MQIQSSTFNQHNLPKRLVTATLITAMLIATAISNSLAAADQPDITCDTAVIAEVAGAGTSVAPVVRAASDRGCFVGSDKMWLVASGQVGLKVSVPIHNATLVSETGMESSTSVKDSQSLSSVFADPVKSTTLAVNPYVRLGLSSENFELSIAYSRLRNAANSAVFVGEANDTVALKCAIKF